MDFVQTMLLLNFPMFVIIASLFVLAISFFIIKKQMLSRRTKVQQIEQHLAKNSKHLDKIEAYLGNKCDENKQIFLCGYKDRLDDIVDKYIQLTSFVIQKNPDEISPLLKFCNHKNFMLAAKVELNSITEKIHSQFLKINDALPYPQVLNDENRNKAYILQNIIPAVLPLTDELNKIKKIELEIFTTAEEYETISTPGVFRKLKGYFSDRDKNRKVEIRRIWINYQEAWKDMRSAIEISKNELDVLLSTYLTKLFIFSSKERLTQAMLKEHISIRKYKYKLKFRSGL